MATNSVATIEKRAASASISSLSRLCELTMPVENDLFSYPNNPYLASVCGDPSGLCDSNARGRLSEKRISVTVMSVGAVRFFRM